MNRLRPSSHLQTTLQPRMRGDEVLDQPNFTASCTYEVVVTFVGEMVA